MEKKDRIYVAGHRGLIGSAIVRRLGHDGYENIITRERHELDLTDQARVRDFFEKEKPDYVFFAAAQVGGIFANKTYRAEFIYENVMMESNIIHYAFLNEVKKMIFFASADIYPKDCPQPASEEYLLDGALEFTCEPFAIAKIAGLKMCESYNRQYGSEFIVVIPPNVYGPNQHYDVMNAQVLPSLLKKFHEAKATGAEEIVIWGSGTPVRDFLYVDDVADVCVFLTNGYPGSETFNVGTGRGTSIRVLAEIIAKEVGYKGKIVFDNSKPDGVKKKLLDTARITAMGWKPATSLATGIRETYRAFLKETETREVRTSRICKVVSTDKDATLVHKVGQKRKVKLNEQPESYRDRVVIKPWGYEFLMFENECVAVWFLYIKKGHSTSMHCHPGKKTSLILLNGDAMSNTFINRRYLNGGDALILDKGVFHSTKALSENGIFLLEIETPPNKSDLMRLEDRYGRESSGYEGISEMETINLAEYNYFSFSEPEGYDKFLFTAEEFSVGFEVFPNDDEFRKHFRASDGELYTVCKGAVLDRGGRTLLDLGDTQKANILSNPEDLRVTGKTVLLKSRTSER